MQLGLIMFIWRSRATPVRSCLPAVLPPVEAQLVAVPDSNAEKLGAWGSTKGVFTSAT